MSEWDKNSADRRDFRNSKDGPEVIKHRRKRNKKQCKKNQNKEHEFETTEVYIVGTKIRWIELKCVHCGKIEFKGD